MKIYGILGKNVSYSLSPLMHNAAFKALGLDAEYKTFEIAEEKLENFFTRLRKGEVSGCNVTIPYKEKALEFVDKYDDLVRDIGALNTLARKEGKLRGYNTDCQGFIESLTGKSEGDLCFNPEGKSVFVFGAGGAARAIIYALVSLGAKKIAITDIDLKKAETLAGIVVEKHRKDTLITVVQDGKQFNEFISKADLVINATPSGMKETDQPLFDYRYMHEKLHVFDLVYARDTELLKEARSLEARAINGLNMLLYQAAAAFRIWTDQKAPIEVMRKALLDRIKK